MGMFNWFKNTGKYATEIVSYKAADAVVSGAGSAINGASEVANYGMMAKEAYQAYEDIKKEGLNSHTIGEVSGLVAQGAIVPLAKEMGIPAPLAVAAAKIAQEVISDIISENGDKLNQNFGKFTKEHPEYSHKPDTQAREKAMKAPNIADLSTTLLEQAKAAGNTIKGEQQEAKTNFVDTALDVASVAMAAESVIPVIGELGAVGQAGIAAARFANGLAKGEGIGGAAKFASGDLALAAADMIPGAGLAAVAARTALKGSAMMTSSHDEVLSPSSTPKMKPLAAAIKTAIER